MMSFFPYGPVGRKLASTSAGRDMLEALKERGITNERIESMSPREMFSEYCTWHGLINWSDRLMYALNAASEATE